MSDSKIDNILDELRSEEERLKKELSELKKQEQEVTKELKAVQSGLAGLVGGKTRKRSAARKPSPQAPRASEVVVEKRHGEVSLETFP